MRLGAGYAVLFAALALVAAASLTVGEGSLGDPGLRSTLLALRASRLGSALLVGSALAVAGVIVQGLFRNPLADASVLGTSAGAALGGKVALLVTEFLLIGRGPSRIPPDVLLPVGCLGGALLSLTIVLALVRRSRDILTVLLTGFLLSSLSLSVGILLTTMAQERPELGRALITLAVGTLTGAGPEHIAIATPLVVVGIAAAWFWGKALDLLLSGDEEAASLGVDVSQVRRCCILWVAVLTAGAVAIGGDIGFVGLLVPHALRPILGVEHRRLVPVAALGGAVFVGLCDLAVRALPARGEVPLGVITGVVGAPVFLTLLLRSQKRAAYG
jgi:iron complex transport system permease protein